MQAGARRRGRGQRLLYFFRTPPGVRVGRAPIDEDAIRLLEEHNPDIQFDWSRILKAPGVDQSPPDVHRERRDRREQRPARRPAVAEHAGYAESSAEHAGEKAQYAEPADYAEPRRQVVDHTDYADRTAEHAADHSDYSEPSAEHADYTDQRVANEVTGRADYAEPAPVDAPEPEARQLPEPVQLAEPTVEPRYARLGSDALGRLRARYAEVMARISEKPLEDVAREELILKAERLNPDAWVTADEVTAALEQYEVVYEELRAVVGRHSRRRRRH